MRLFVLVFALILAGCRMPHVLPDELAGQGHKIPGLETGAVPQGLAYLPEKHLLLISYYHPDNRPSVILTMDSNTGKVVHTTELRNPDGEPHRGHVGGLAAASSTLWVASDSYLYQFDLREVLEEKYADALAAYQTEATEEVAFCALHDGKIWAGEFAMNKRFPTHRNHHLSDRNGSSRGGWISSHSYDALKAGNGTAGTSQVLSIPDRTQDVHFVDEYIVLSRSYGRRRSSVIEVYTNPLTEEPHRLAQTSQGKEVPLWFLDAANRLRSIPLPPMTENIEVIDQQLIVLFESGAQKYKRFGRSPRHHFMRINLDELLKP